MGVGVNFCLVFYFAVGLLWVLFLDFFFLLLNVPSHPATELDSIVALRVVNAIFLFLVFFFLS